MAAASLLYILRTIREHGSISRTTLQQVTNLSWGTITNSTRDLLNRNLLREENVPTSRAGRKPVHLSINRLDQYLVGLELNDEALHCLAIDLAGDVLWEGTTPIRASDAPDTTFDAGAELIRQALVANAARACLGIGMAVPGPLDAAQEILIEWPERPNWKNIPVRAAFQSRLKSAVFLERHTHCLALAERWFGDAGHVQDLLCIDLDERVGMGIVIDGDIFRGSQGLAGDFGRMMMGSSETGTQVISSVDSHCSLAAVRKYAQDVVPAIKRDASNIQTLIYILDAAQAGNPPVLAAFEHMGRYLGIAIANAMDLFNPELVILAGKATIARAYFIPALLREVESHAGPQAGRNVVVSAIPGHATAMGACAMILESAFSRQQ